MIGIFTPTKDFVTAGFNFDLAQLIRYDVNTVYVLTQGTYLGNLRNGAAETALKHGLSHVLFIDSDMRFPPDTAMRLANRKAAIIGANCKQRSRNITTAVRNGEFIPSEGRTGLELVDTLGMGVTMIDVNVFNKIPKPWFHTPWDASSNKQVGEDVYFCTEARKKGFLTFVDHDLSKEVRHSGMVEFAI